MNHNQILITSNWSRSKYFPCWVCKGKGGEKQVICDDGTGPYDECGFCEGEGIIEIDGKVHMKIKYESIAREAIKKFKPKKVEWSLEELLILGKKIEKLVKTISEEK